MFGITRETGLGEGGPNNSAKSCGQENTLPHELISGSPDERAAAALQVKNSAVDRNEVLRELAESLAMNDLPIQKKIIDGTYIIGAEDLELSRRLIESLRGREGISRSTGIPKGESGDSDLTAVDLSDRSTTLAAMGVPAFIAGMEEFSVEGKSSVNLVELLQQMSSSSWGAKAACGLLLYGLNHEDQALKEAIKVVAAKAAFLCEPLIDVIEAGSSSKIAAMEALKLMALEEWRENWNSRGDRKDGFSIEPEREEWRTFATIISRCERAREAGYGKAADALVDVVDTVAKKAVEIRFGISIEEITPEDLTRDIVRGTPSKRRSAVASLRSSRRDAEESEKEISFRDEVLLRLAGELLYCDQNGERGIIAAMFRIGKGECKELRQCIGRLTTLNKQAMPHGPNKEMEAERREILKTLSKQTALAALLMMRPKSRGNPKWLHDLKTVIQHGYALRSKDSKEIASKAAAGLIVYGLRSKDSHLGECVEAAFRTAAFVRPILIDASVKVGDLETGKRIAHHLASMALSECQSCEKGPDAGRFDEKLSPTLRILRQRYEEAETAGHSKNARVFNSIYILYRQLRERSAAIS